MGTFPPRIYELVRFPAHPEQVGSQSFPGKLNITKGQRTACLCCYKMSGLLWCQGSTRWGDLSKAERTLPLATANVSFITKMQNVYTFYIEAVAHLLWIWRTNLLEERASFWEPIIKATLENLLLTVSSEAKLGCYSLGKVPPYPHWRCGPLSKEISSCLLKVI